jgi:hypothetical protein
MKLDHYEAKEIVPSETTLGKVCTGEALFHFTMPILFLKEDLVH